VIADLKPYPAYKKSGLTWLPEMPGHWEVLRSKYLFREVDQRSTDGSEQRLSMSQRHGLIPSSQIEERRLTSESNVGGKLCKPGDLVLNRLKAHLGVLAVSPSHGVVSPDYTVLRPLGTTNHRYFCEVYRSPYCGQELRQRAKGIVEGFWRLYTDDFYDIRVPLPPPDEQAAIVRFLDWANGRLERAIRAKRKVIALLNEQKQAIIHRAVTRGLDPSVPLKPSGVQWLGDIPQGWTLRRFKFVAQVNSGQVDPRRSEYRNLVLIAPNHIEQGSGRLLKHETANEQGADSGKYLVSCGQVIYSKIRPNLRKATVAPLDCLCSADMYPISPIGNALCEEYLLLLLLSEPFTKFAVDTSMRVAMPKVNREALANCLMWYPGIHEQRAILKKITDESSPIDTAISRIEREITLLREYRTRLIADVVTGQLDVREAAARLPDDAPLDALDAQEADPDLIDDPETADEEAIS
jgi:type I restriction enzyme S subunit